MTAEGKFFHRNCFRCEYCNMSLRIGIKLFDNLHTINIIKIIRNDIYNSVVCAFCSIGNYVFDREGRYGERFYCSPHYTTIRMCGWKKFDNGRVEDVNKYGGEVHNLLGNRPSSQQVSHHSGGLLPFCKIHPLDDDFCVETIFFVLFTLLFFVISLLVNPPEVTDFVLDNLIVGL